MKRFLSRYVKDESGAAAIEYALIASLIFFVIITAVTGAGASLTSVFTAVSGGLK